LLRSNWPTIHHLVGQTRGCTYRCSKWCGGASSSPLADLLHWRGKDAPIDRSGLLRRRIRGFGARRPAECGRVGQHGAHLSVAQQHHGFDARQFSMGLMRCLIRRWPCSTSLISQRACGTGRSAPARLGILCSEVLQSVTTNRRVRVSPRLRTRRKKRRAASRSNRGQLCSNRKGDPVQQCQPI
jgi:hypothetical protein